GEALRAAAKRSPLDVTVRAGTTGRHPEQVEAAVYFCCLEALANVGKHAPGASVTITLETVPGELRFEVADDGPRADRAAGPGPGRVRPAPARSGSVRPGSAGSGGLRLGGRGGAAEVLTCEVP